MNFNNFGFKRFINTTLNEIKFTNPTDIQAKIIPLIKKHQNVIALSHTGTGKTHAFLLPVLNNLQEDKMEQTQAVILAPTRELAKQIYEDIKPFSQNNSLIKAELFIGGDDIEKQVSKLEKRQPTIVVGTPTRVKELFSKNALKFTTADYIVVDECDMIFDLGFIEDLDFLFSKTKKNINISLFSATIAENIRPFIKKYIKNAHFVDVTKNQKTTSNIKHVIIDTKNKEIDSFFSNLVSSINPYLCLVFVNNKDDIDRFVKIIREKTNLHVGELHGGLQPRTRMNMLKKIKNNEFKFVVATDVAARGVDIIGVSHVISIDLPNDLSYYIHRSGRTGRNKMTGESYVLFNMQNKAHIETLQNQGISFSLKKINDESLVDIKAKKTKKNITFSKLDDESKKVIGKYQNQKVKPGYKKKRKNELDEIKKKKRRENIKKSIDRIKKIKYKKRREELFD